MATSICSAFTITAIETITGGQTLTITNPGRTMQVVGIRAQGASDAEIAVYRAEPGGATTKFGDVTMSLGPGGGLVNGLMTPANATLTATEEIQVTVTGGAVTAVHLDCIGSPSQALTTATA